MRTKFTILSASAFGLACASTSPVHAQSLDDRFWVEGSLYWADVDSKAHAEPANASVPGTTIDFESDLDLSDSKAMPTFTAGARAGSHWIFTAEYYALSRKATATIDRDIVFDDDTYHANANVESKFDSSVYRFTVGYSFVRNDTFELGGALGFHGTDFTLELAGDASVGNSPVVSSQVRRRKAFAPLPTVGLYGTIQASPKIAFNGRIDYLSLSIGDYDGRLVNAQAEGSYRVMKNLDLGAMWRFVNYRLDVSKTNWEGRVKYKFSGPAIFARLVF